jgi:hypothetical protein
VTPKQIAAWWKMIERAAKKAPEVTACCPTPRGKRCFHCEEGFMHSVPKVSPRKLTS